MNAMGVNRSSKSRHVAATRVVPLVSWLLAIAIPAAWGQVPPVAPTSQTARYAEPLNAMLERGFPRDWFVCGPFPSDLPEGIIRAAAGGMAALGSRDFMEPLGGVAMTRPIPLLAVERPQAVWQAARLDTPRLDFSSLFRGRDEGVAYAAFYVTVDAATPVFFEAHTPFGARWWINGQSYRDIRAASLEEAGVDRFLAVLPPGQHLVMFEAPLADLDVLARALDVSIAGLLNGVWANRSMLSGANGWEIALRVRRAVASGPVHFDTLPRDTGRLSGTAGDVRRLFTLAAWNHGPTASPPGTIDMRNGTLAAQVELPALRPYETEDVLLPVPVPADGPGAGGGPVTLTARAGGGDPAIITLTMTGAPWPRNPVTWMGVGPLRPARDMAALDREVSLLTDLALLQGRWRGGGFYAAGPDDLLPFFAARPDLLDLAAPLGRSAFMSFAAADSTPDPRVARPETARRDTATTLGVAQALLGHTPESAAFTEGPLPDAAGFERLAELGIRGAIVSEGYRFMPGVSAIPLDPGGWFVLRRDATMPSPEHGDALPDTLGVSRRADNRQGFGPSLVLMDVTGGVPGWLEPLLPRLPSLYPPARIDRLAPDAYFAAMPTLLTSDGVFPPDRLATGMVSGNRPGLLLRFPAMHRAWTETESLLTAGETAVTLCGLAGARAPLEDLDWGWRVLSARGAWWRLAGMGSQEDLLDSFGDLCAAREMIRSRVEEALQALGDQVNTMGVAPKFGRQEGTRAVLLFNAAPEDRTVSGELEADVTGMERPALVDALDEPMPFTLDIRETTAQDGTPRQVGRFRFLARQVPATGYATCFIRSGGTPDTPVRDNRPVLENDRVLLEFDPDTGDLRRYTDKFSGWSFDAPGIGAVFALNNDASRTADGAELWTSGPAVRPGAPTFTARRLSWMQELTVEQPFLEGKLVRRWQVSEGEDWPRCEIAFEGVDAGGRAVFLSSPSPDPGCVPIAGGSGRPVVGRRHTRPDLYRTRDEERPTGTYFLPAAGWFAASGSDTLRSKDGKTWSLQPALIIPGEDIQLRRTARALAIALYRRGIPAVVTSDALEREPWPDANAPACPHLKYHTDAPLRIALGSPESNRYASTLIQTLSSDHRREIADVLQRGEAVLLPDSMAHPGNGPVTALVLGGTAQDIEDRVNHALEAYRESGALTFDRVTGMGVDPVPRAEQAVVFTWPGTLPAGMDPDGRVVIALWAPPDGDNPLPSAPPTREFWLRAGPGDWRSLGAPEAASRLRTPLFSAICGIQPGPMPHRQSLLTLGGPGVILETVKTAGYAVAAHRAALPGPRDGMLLRLSEPYGTAWSGSASWYTPLAAAALADGLERRVTDLPVTDGNRIPCAVPPFAATSFWVLPKMILPTSPTNVQVDQNDAPRMFCRYWRQGMVTPPSRGLPLTVSLQGTLTAPECEVTLTVANYLVDGKIESVAHLSTSLGWRAEPSQVYVALNPGERGQWKIRVTSEESPDGTGGVMAWMFWNGARWVDTLAEKTLRPVVRVDRESGRLRVTTRNPWSFPACGSVELQCFGFVTPEWVPDFPVRAPLVLEGNEERTVFLALPPEGVTARVRITLNDAEPQRLEIPGS